MVYLIATLQELWVDGKGIVVGSLLLYAGGYLGAVGYGQVAEVENIYPALTSLVFVTFVFSFCAVVDGWLDQKKCLGRTLFLLIIIFFSPLLFAKLSHSWFTPTVSEWSAWLKFRLAGFTLFVIAFDALIEYINELERRYLKSSESEASLPPNVA